VRAVNEFAAAGVQLSAVNIMTMNYGDGTTDMGTAAIAAAKATGAQLGSVPAYAFLTSAQRLSLVGVTPMVGLNDIPREVFTLADATKVGAFARANGLAGLGWGGDDPRPAVRVQHSGVHVLRSDQLTLVLREHVHGFSALGRPAGRNAAGHRGERRFPARRFRQD
jgi:hypothetical protein